MQVSDSGPNSQDPYQDRYYAARSSAQHGAQPTGAQHRTTHPASARRAASRPHARSAHAPARRSASAHQQHRALARQTGLQRNAQKTRLQQTVSGFSPRRNASPMVGSARPAQAASPVTGAPTNQGSSNPQGFQPIQFKKGMKVLQIGDSHTVGSFGTEMDKRLRASGASVETYGSAGSSPDWWVSGRSTTMGFVGRHADGSVDQNSNWRAPHATPKLAELIRRNKPDVLLVNMGANFRGASPDAIRKEVAALGEIAKKSGTRLVWVGPPTQRSENGRPASLSAFDQSMRAAVSPYGSYISSQPYTPSYVGSDPSGIHYTGTAGTAAAKAWAAGIWRALSGS